MIQYDSVLMNPLYFQISKTYKFGIMYCRAGQSSEEDMYNNGTFISYDFTV